MSLEYQLIKPINETYSVLEQIFTNRDFDLKDIEHYLNTTDNDILPPTSIMNINLGAKLLIQNIYNKNKVFFIIDSDADGYTSSAILINYLYLLFPEWASQNIIYEVHEDKAHGLTDAMLNKIKNSSAKLVVCADSSSNDYDQHKELTELGFQILIIDHHEADEISKYACVINNQLCDYPTKTLSGAGMVYKFCCYIDEILNKGKFADELIDLAMCGIIADVMKLNNFETKRIIEKGIQNLKNPFVTTMVEKNKFSIGDEVTPTGIAFYVAPQINATTRVGTYEEKKILFESMLNHKAYEIIPSTKRGCKGQTETLVEQACRNCTNIKNRQTKYRNASLEIAEEIIKKENLLSNKILAIRLPKEKAANKNLTGLIANVLMDKYQQPVLLLNEVTKEDGIWWEGSGRGCNNSKLTDFREFLISCGVEDVGGFAQGHPQAFGFSVPDFYFDTLIQKANSKLMNFDFNPCYKVDFIYGSRDCNAENILQIANLKSLWGQGIEEPLIAFENINITSNNLTLMSPDRNPTMKITLPNGISCIKFKSSQEEIDKLTPTGNGSTVINIIGTCEKNEWCGNITAQIIIEDYEIVGKRDYYF